MRSVKEIFHNDDALEQNLSSFISDSLLKALHNNLGYRRHNNHNEITYVARKSRPRTLKMVLGIL